jgi:predicted PurR-regulated permease PerM
VANGNRTSDHRSSVLLTVIVAVAALYFARVVFIPIALAVLLAFLLAPLVVRLRRWHFGRMPSVLIVVLFSFVLIGILGSVMAAQMADIGRKLPQYQENVREKVRSISNSGSGLVNRITRAAHNFTQDISPPAARQSAPGEDKPVPVEIRKAPFAPLELAQKVIGSMLDAVLMALIVIVFVIFMLFQREDLRDRLIRLVGAGQIKVTTQALDDAGQRLSRYLLAQLVVNVAFGTLAGIGLYFIGVPDPILWALVAMLLRYVPYLGIWVAAAFPALLVFAVDPGWVKVPIIFGLYAGIDLVMYNFVEPYLYGNTTGLTPLAILIAAVFWTWLWGPVGLLLATPLTVCLAVMGRYVPSLEFLRILLTDEPVLNPHSRFYQRLLAGNLEEATELAEDFIKGKSLEDLGDRVIIPALSLVEEDRHRGNLDLEKQKLIFENLRILIDDVAERSEQLIADGKEKKSPSADHEVAQIGQGSKSAQDQASVVCVPARDEADQIAALLLEQILARRSVALKVLSCSSLAGECIEELKHAGAGVACVAVVPPFGQLNARYMCRRLRAQFPDLKLIGAILTERPPEELKARTPAIVADELTSSLKQTVTAVLSYLPTSEEVKQAA